MKVKELYDVLVEAKIDLAYVVRLGGELKISHDEIEPFKDLVLSSSGYAEHEGVFVGCDPKYKTVFLASVHDTTRGLSQGGLRMYRYNDLDGAVKDGLRLSQGMTRKNAICGLWWGGGKGIIPITDELIAETFEGDKKAFSAADSSLTKEENDRRRKIRDGLFEAYGEFVAKLNGVYYTAADMNTYNADMKAIIRRNRFVTCIPEEMGGSGDPSPHTADGVFRAIKSTYEFLNDNAGLNGVKVAIQGTGKVGRPLIEKLSAEGAEIFASDIKLNSKEEIDSFKKIYPNVEIIPSDADKGNDIFAVDVDVIAPCAGGGIINAETIALFHDNVKIVCGGANNILEDEDKDGELLFEKGITYIPDFICNWMGIVNCANEAFGYLEEDIEIALENVPPIVNELLKESTSQNSSTMSVSNKLADEKAKELPPLELLKNRGQRLIANVVKNNANRRG